MTKISIFEKEKEKLENLIYFTFTYKDFPHLFKDLIWGVIRYKEDKKEDSIKCFGEFCEHCHRFIFKFLNNNFMKQKIILKTDSKKPKDWEIVDKLQNRIFPDLKIEYVDLLTETRKIVDIDYNKAKHEFEDKNTAKIVNIDFLKTSVLCIKFFLLVRLIRRYPNLSYEKFKAKNFKIEKEFSFLFNNPKDEIVDIFLFAAFGRKNRDVLLSNKILSLRDIENSKIIQFYYPLYIYFDWKIDNILSQKEVYPFRTIGPHLVDFDKGNWIYIPKIAKYIFKLLKIINKSVLISAESGTGKTVISRYIGNCFLKQNFKVYYIDCLEHESNKVENVLDQLGLNFENNITKINSILFIFDNVHILNDDLKSKLNRCKDLVLCFIIERNFKDVKEKENQLLNFDFYQKFRIDLSHWTYKNTVKGIIKQNSGDLTILNQLKSIGNQNLWVYSIILKQFLENLQITNKTSLIELFTNHELIGDNITEYLKNLINKKLIDIKSSQDTLFLNHTKYFLALLSIFSEFELWTEDRFLNQIIKIADNSPLGCFNRDISINYEVLGKIQSFLIDIFEIESRNVDFKPGIKEKEFKIPHSQMAIIYKNCILKIFEKSYPSLIEQITYLYVFYGKYFGTYLDKKWASWTLSLSQEENKDSKIIYFDFEKFLKMPNFQNSTKYIILNQKSFLEQLKVKSLHEIIIFYDRLTLDGVSKEKHKISHLIINLVLLDDSYWKNKIMNSNYKDIYYFLELIKETLSEKCLFNFFLKFKDNILQKFSESSIAYIIRLMFIILKLPKEEWHKISRMFKNFILEKDETFVDELSITLGHFENFEEKLESNHYIFSILKLKLEQYISNSNLNNDLRFFNPGWIHRRKFFQKIYLNTLQKIFENNSKEKKKIENIFKQKIKLSNLEQFLIYLINLNTLDHILSLKFLKNFINEIREIMDKADITSLKNFLFELPFMEYDSELIISLFLKNWNWFKNLFLKFNFPEIIENYNGILYFLENNFPKYKDQFESFICSITREKIIFYYEHLDKKLDIFKSIKESRLLDEIKDIFLDLCEKAVKFTLENLNFKLNSFTNLFNEIEKNSYAKKLLYEEFNFKTIISNNKFKNSLYSTKNEEIFEYMKILENYNKWYNLFLEEFKDFLSQKYGVCYRIIQHCSEMGKRSSIELPNMIQNLDIEKIILISNSTFRIWYNLNYGYNNVQNIMNVDRCFQEFIYENIRKNEREFLSDKFGEILLNIDINILFNFIIILFKFHKEILHKIFNKYENLIKDRFKNSQLDLFDLLYILEKYEFSIKSLELFDKEFSKENFFYSHFLNLFKNLDLFRLRALFKFLLEKQENFKVVEEILGEVEFKKILEQSNLLQISIALSNDHISLVKKPSGLVFVKGQKITRQVRVEPEIFDKLTEGLKNVISEKDKNFSLISFDAFIIEEKESFIKDSVFFSDVILFKIKESNLFDINQYLETLKSWIKEFKEVISNPPAPFFDFFKSEEFLSLIKKSSFDVINNFFFILSELYLDFSKLIWEENFIYFISKDFYLKLKEARFNQIYNFFMFTLNNPEQFTNDIIELLNKKIENIDFNQLIQSLLQLNQSDIEFTISIFKKEINTIILNTSKTDLKYGFREHFLSKEEKNKQQYIKKKLPIINQKVKEKYFFNP